MNKEITSTLKDPLKLLVWAYFFLLILEGALRKWILPGLSNPLLIVRDPLVVLIYLLAYSRYRKAFTNPYGISILAISFLGLMTCMVTGHKNLLVGIFGFRTFFLHFPLIFVIGFAFNKNDVVLFGKAILLMSIPMTLLLVAQFSSPRTAFVNLAPGGIVDDGIMGAMGKLRPPGTFSFITGVVQFYTLAGAFLFSALVERKYFPLPLTIATAVAIAVAVPISISRSLFIGVLITTAFAFYGILRSGVKATNVIRIAGITLVAIILLSQIGIFKEGSDVFTARWEAATGAEQGGVEKAIIGRFLEETFEPLTYLWYFGPFGQGIGLGTQVGSKIMTNEQWFLAGEGEWRRMLLELGFIFGPLMIVTRIALAFKIFTFCHSLLKQKNLLPWLLFSSSGLLLVNGQWGQPTTLGFSVFGIGICLASGKKPKKTSSRPKSVETPTRNSSPSKPPPPKPGGKRELPPLK